MAVRSMLLVVATACVPSAPPVGPGGGNGDAGAASGHDGQAGSTGGTGAATGGSGGGPIAGGTGGTGGAAGAAPSAGSGGTPAGGTGGQVRIDGGPRRDAPTTADAGRRPDAGPPRADTGPPAPDGPPGAPPSPPGGPCTPGGTGLDTTTPGLVLDRKTCLIWQRQDPPRDVSACPLMIRDNPSKLCFDEAVKSCTALRLDSKSDWRLPTQTELSTLVVANNSPAVDPAAFPEAVVSLYWTSQTASGKVTCVDFSNRGMVNPNIGPDGPQAFRCVRGPATAR